MKYRELFFGGILVLLSLTLIFSTGATILSITLNSPANNAWTPSLAPVFNFRAISDSDATFSCNLVVNGSVVATNNSVANNTNTNISPMLPLQQGQYKWNITCADSLGSRTSETRTLYIDSEAPVVTLISPADGYNSSSTKTDFQFKVTDNLDSSLECTLYIDGDDEESGNVNNGSTTTWTVSGLTREDHEWQVKCKDNAQNEGTSETRDFTIEEVGYCKYGEQGTGLALSIESPESGDEIYAGDNVSVKVNVENSANDDLDIVIKVELYDLDEEDSIVTTSYETTIKEDDEKTYTLYLKIPTNVDEDNNYVINAKVYEDGNEEEECKEDSIDVSIDKKSHSVVINSFSLSPTTVECGKSFTTNFKIENAGSNDEDVKITIRNLALGVNYLKELSLDSGDNYEGTTTFNVPSNVTETEYEIVLTVYYNLYDNTYESQTSDTETVLVRGGCFVEQTDAIISVQQISQAFNGQEFALKVTVVNTGNILTTYTVNVSNYDSWASLPRMDSTTLTLNSGESGYTYIYLIPSENATGMNTLKVRVTFGSTTKEESVTVNIQRATSAASWLDQIVFELKRNWQWIFVDVVLVAAIIILIVALMHQVNKNRGYMNSEPPEIRGRTINDKEFKGKRKRSK
ncbi:MAG: putative S-layer protein [Candidatus Pacearchaeota archaeon]